MPTYRLRSLSLWRKIAFQVRILQVSTRHYESRSDASRGQTFSVGHEICFFGASGHSSTEVFERPKGTVDCVFEQRDSLWIRWFRASNVSVMQKHNTGYILMNNACRCPSKKDAKGKEMSPGKHVYQADIFQLSGFSYISRGREIAEREAIGQRRRESEREAGMLRGGGGGKRGVVLYLFCQWRWGLER